MLEFSGDCKIWPSSIRFQCMHVLNSDQSLLNGKTTMKKIMNNIVVHNVRVCYVGEDLPKKNSKSIWMKIVERAKGK